MRAIDGGVVHDLGHGQYRARRGRATEPLFWEGQRNVHPRPITLWLEPVITFAALARLRFDLGWPDELLGNQPQDFKFDLAAHDPRAPDRYRILGEVKKTVKEAEQLLQDLLLAASGSSVTDMRSNSARKWKALVANEPAVLWIVGPGRYSKVFACSYGPEGQVALQETAEALRFGTA